jgi:hypothetical protein
MRGVERELTKPRCVRALRRVIIGWTLSEEEPLVRDSTGIGGKSMYNSPG